ncbi:hypothetical protein [Sphingomonas rubra]|uniref:Uncharacterized protein n=1 Tax=Sphingomonas rubra TaxID=634430 RepID=A0A1I5UXJ8_9SPHN|nr:hypothetical protein [Sphingomonas rubra]SFP99922.1 hypothetical protein SAMN04488241_11915 [Sphingomonas rubra]
MKDERTYGDQPVTQGDDKGSGTKTVSHDGEGSQGGGTDNPGKNGEDRDILGKKQGDLDADDLSGDARSDGVE